MNHWKLVKLAAECEPCDMCGEPVCAECGMHYADCDCPGPHQDDIYEYKEENGIMYARLLDEEK